MSDLGLAETAAQTASGVVTQATSGNAWAFAAFVVGVAALLVAFWIWRVTGKGSSPRHDPPPDPGCKSPVENCPVVQTLSMQLKYLEEKIDQERDEWRSYRQENRNDIRQLHARIDEHFRMAPS